MCGLCGEPVERERVHIDHILPVVRGGTNALSNLQVSHDTCNMRKGARG
jgi:5-methylcytosine-specific restriction endonuclease McrA